MFLAIAVILDWSEVKELPKVRELPNHGGNVDT